jgi:hypothetical protein
MFSDDEVGVFLFGWNSSCKRPKLVSTKEADEFFRKNNVSLSTSEDPDQQRVAHIGATLQAHTGDLTCFYLCIVDSLFPQEFKTKEPSVSKPRIWLLNPKLNFYVVTCHPSVTDTTIMEYIGKYIIHPAIFKKQDEIINREISGEVSIRKCSSDDIMIIEEEENNIGTTTTINNSEFEGNY